MARVLLAWELGANYGHVVGLRALATVLRAAGHDCCFAVRQLGSAQETLDPALGPCFQAPVRAGPARNPVKTQTSYASVLHNTGFDDPVELAGRIRAWRDLLQALRIDYVYADHSPVAVIAARTLRVRACYLGSGFLVPPRQSPFPSFRPAMKIAPGVLAHNDGEVLKELNAALSRLGQPALSSLQDIFSDATPALLTYPELDHYETPRPEPYLGMPDHARGAAPAWPDGAGPRVFVYLRPAEHLAAVLDALSKSPVRVLACLPGVAPALWSRFRRSGWTLAEGPVHFGQAAREADAFVGYAGVSTVTEFLLGGKPGLLLPLHQEQVLAARRAVSLGAAVAVRGKDVAQMITALEKVVADTGMRDAARQFAARYQDQDRTRILPDLVASTLG